MVILGRNVNKHKNCKNKKIKNKTKLQIEIIMLIMSISLLISKTKDNVYFHHIVLCCLSLTENKIKIRIK